MDFHHQVNAHAGRTQNAPRTIAGLAFHMVGGRGVEPLTSCMSSMRSNQLS